MPSFLDRLASTDQGESQLQTLLVSSGLEVIPLGQTNLLKDQDESSVSGVLKKLMIKNFDIDEFAAGFMIKFSPDLMILGDGIEPFLLDVKVSRTPVLFQSKIDAIKSEAKDPSVRGIDIGVVEREAWDVYGKFFPPERVAICYLAPYSEKKISIQWRDKIKCLFRFADDHNPNAGGSKTPHVNIDLRSMDDLFTFFTRLGVTLQPDFLANVLSTVREWPIEKPPGKVSWTQFRGSLRRYALDVPGIKAKFPDDMGGALDVNGANQLDLRNRRSRVETVPDGDEQGDGT